jgi:hypothetical protein
MGTPFIYCHRSGDGSSTPRPLLPSALLMRARAENAKMHFAFFFCANGDFPGFGVYARS